MKSEKAIQTEIIKYLRSEMFLVFKINDRFYSGLPDIYCCRIAGEGRLAGENRSGVSYWFEVKNEAGKLSPLQSYEIRQIKEHGIFAGVVRSVEDVKHIIREV